MSNLSEEKIIKKLKYGIYKDFEEYDKYINAMIDLYNKEKEKNKEINERLQEEINENCILKTKLYGESISKDKIREKIEELEHYLNTKIEIILPHEKIKYSNQIEVLQELLEE